MDFMNVIFTGGTPEQLAPGGEGEVSGNDQLATLLAGGSATFGVIGDITAGLAEAEQLRFAAEFDEVAAEAAQVQALAEANDLREAMLETMAMNNAAAASSGIDVTSGAVQGTNIRSANKTGRAIARVVNQGELTASGLRLRASQRRSAARSAELQGFLRAGGRVLSFASSAARIG